MHRSLVLLIAVTLLLRGWVGEAMAGQMLALQLQAAGAPVEVVVVHGPDCPGMAAQDEAGDVDAAAKVLHCQDCTLNALPAPTLAVARPLPVPAASAPQPVFTSAEPQPGLKPPIS